MAIYSGPEVQDGDRKMMAMTAESQNDSCRITGGMEIFVAFFSIAGKVFAQR